MSKFTKRTVSPFRCDVVGSFLRPQELKDARAKYAEGKITREELTQVEDRCIIDLIKKEEQVGLTAITDGEFRRSWWHLDFIWGLNGLEKAQSAEGYTFHDEITRAETARVCGKINGNNHPFVEHFKFVKSHISPGHQAKQTIPSPAQAFVELQRPENAEAIKKYYQSQEALISDFVTAYQQVIRDLYAAGCRIVQFDDCTWGALVDWHSHPENIPVYGMKGAALDQAKENFVNINNAVIQGLPEDLVIQTHVCRGNYHSTWANSGGYDYVADPLFTKENVRAFFLEYDNDRSGGFEPLAKVPKGKCVVLGLITSKSGELEDKQTIINRIHEAAKYVPLDNLCLSPQCGFASTEEGNILTEEQQWNKLKLIKEISEQVWG